MKYCTQCNNTYADDNLGFCLADGAPLMAARFTDTERTHVSRVTAAPPPTVILQPSYQPQPPPPPSGTPPWMYAVLGAMGMVIVALVGLLVVPQLLSDDGKENRNATSQAAPQTASNPTRTEVREAPKAPEPAPADAPAEVAGAWQGEWSSALGTVFSAQLHLEATGNSVQGTINWTMTSTRQAAKQARVGLTAVEYVRGSYDAATRTLVMAGYKKDDPNKIISLDKYRLTLGGRTLGGPTSNGGKWNARISLSR